MKKLTFIFALLCASVMTFSMQYCDVATGHENNADYGNTDARILLTIEPTGNANEYRLTVKPNTANGNTSKLDYIYAIAGGNSPYPAEAGIDEGGSSYDELSVTFTNSNANASFTIQWSTPGWGGRWQCTPSDVPLSSLEACGGGSSKPSPELSINATTKTLEIEASAETFQIVPTKAVGSGAVSYESSNNEVVTISNTGLVTAEGAGTATITVSVAENDDFAAESKTLTVTVIDWSSIGWLTNSSDSYKLHIQPEIADGFGGKRIEGSNLWVGFPSADFGACSIEYSAVGAGVSFPLNNFTSYRSQFTMVCQGTTYTFTVYRKFDGVNLAKGMPSYAGATALPKAEANDGNRGSRWASGASAKHYPAYKDAAEDWWYVDLGAMYEISSIKTLFEGAAPKNYDFLTSPNGDSWVVIDSYNATPNIGNEEANYNEYSYSPGKVGRYVKIFAREAVQGDFAYGISIWEFEVYGLPAEDYDTNNPVLSSASLSGDPTSSQVQIAVSATDAEGAVTTYRVKDTSHGVDHNCTVAAGIITINDLAEGTNYSFTVTALDAIGNQSNAIVVAATTAADLTAPQVAAPTPDGTGKDVLAIYSDVFPNILAHSFDKDGFAGMPLHSEKNIGGDHCLIYDRSGSAPTYTTWGMYDDGANAIIAATGYSDPEDVAHKGVDASSMTNLHIDIWSIQACATILVRINDGGRTGDLRLSHNGSGWQSYDIPLSEFEAGANINNVRWFKFEAFDAVTGKIAIDNVYFWRPASGSYTVSASVNNGSMGSATAKVGDDDATIVSTGTEVTFTATPNEDYDFVNWTNGGVEVSTSATYVATITANTALVANFEAHRTEYCGTQIVDPTWGTILYLTISNPSSNTYKILVEGSADYKIASAYNNFNFALTHVNGETGTTTFPAASWTVDNTGYGSAYITFTAADFRAITFNNSGSKYIVFNKQGGGTMEFRAFPDANLIKWDATCADDEAPVLAAPVATPLSGTSVRLALSATDNMAALLTYIINYKPAGDAGAGTDVEVAGAAGEATYQNIKGLSAGVRYQFSVTVTDGTNTSAAQICYATPTMPTAPVPTHNAGLVRSVYSDKYESALAHDFIKNNWSGAVYTEQNIGGDHLLVYTSDPSVQAQMPDVAWGEDNDGANAIIAKDGFNDGTNKGLDVRSMTYIHFDIWSAIATIYPEIYLNDTKLAGFHLDGTGWQSFDLPLASLTDEQKTNVRWIKFIALRTPNPEEIAIDNVYFWSYGVTTNQDNWSSFACAYDVQIPSGITAYKAAYEVVEGNEQLTLTSIGSVIPANTGVILRSIDPNTTHVFTITDPVVVDMSDNDLVGCAVRTDISAVHADYDVFCLRRSDLDQYQMTGFFLYTGQYIPAGKAYLKLPKNPGTPAPERRLRLVINETETTTAIDHNAADGTVSKFIRDGQLFIRRGDTVYTIQGVLVK